jgi:OmpA-OmpF porin, OOP family
LTVLLLPLAAQAAQPVEKVTVRAMAHFDFDSTALRPEDQASLLAEVSGMKDVSWQSVTATGHTDSVGQVAYNAALARRRATAVKRYLTGKGLPPALVRTDARGPAQPLADNATEDGRARNRRTEVLFEGVRSASR